MGFCPLCGICCLYSNFFTLAEHDNLFGVPIDILKLFSGFEQAFAHRSNYSNLLNLSDVPRASLRFYKIVSKNAELSSKREALRTNLVYIKCFYSFLVK